MSALSSVYVSLTSLLAFSKALDVIGDNVANLNTTGFKGSDLLFFDIADDRAGLQDMPREAGGRVAGFGTSVRGGGRRFLEGEIRQTGNAAHLAIRGQGFFVLNTAEGQVLTRAGQFDLAESGKLVDPNTGGALQVHSNGQLTDLVIDVKKTNPSSPTTKIAFTGNLRVGDSLFNVSQLKFFDADGTERSISLDFESMGTAQAGGWKVVIKDEQGMQMHQGEIRFQPSGYPSPGYNTIDLFVTTASGKSSMVALDFGTPGSLSGGATWLSGPTSNLTGSAADGYGLGRLTQFQFDAQGKLTLTYSNGQTEEGGQVALALVPDSKQLDTRDGVYFRAIGTAPEIGVAGSGGFGSIAPRSLELANIELAREFADIIILQRGYQASSQVMNVSSQMIEDLYNSVSGRR